MVSRSILGLHFLALNDIHYTDGVPHEDLS